MGLLNDINCAAPGRGNTGWGSCVVDFGAITGVILIPKGTEIAYSTLAALKTSLTNGQYANLPSARYYPITGLIPNADNTEDVSIQTYPDGTKVITAEGKYDYTFTLPLGGKFCLQHRLRKHNSTGEDVLLVVDKKYLLGTEGSTAASIKGITPTISYAQPVRFSQGTDATTNYLYRLSFEPTQINDRPQIVTFTDGFLGGLTGLQDVALTKISRSVNLLTIKAKTACGTVNMYDLYSTQLAAVAAWKAFTEGGNELTITSVTADANNNAFVLTISTSDPDYVAGEPILVKMAGPNDLKTLNVIGFESDQISVTV